MMWNIFRSRLYVILTSKYVSCWLVDLWRRKRAKSLTYSNLRHSEKRCCSDVSSRLTPSTVVLWRDAVMIEIDMYNISWRVISLYLQCFSSWCIWFAWWILSVAQNIVSDTRLLFNSSWSTRSNAGDITQDHTRTACFEPYLS